MLAPAGLLRPSILTIATHYGAQPSGLSHSLVSENAPLPLPPALLAMQ